VHFECRLFSSEGEARWFRVHVRREELSSRRAELAGVMVDITEQKRAAEASRELSMAILRAQERERKTISRELHDSIGQHLTGLNYGLGRLARSRAGSRGVQETVQECLRIVQTCMREIRSVSYMLHPPLLDLMGLGPALRSLVEKFSRQSGIRVEMDVPVRNGAAGALDSDAQMALFRIAQESLTNIQRHARTKSARLRLAYEPASVVLEVEDHGIGIEPSLIEGLDADGGERGLGLLKMRERVTDLKGSLEIQSNGKGTAIRVRIPRPPEKPSKDLMRESGPRGQPKRLRDIS
jgi:signal transduction histidine kinase